MLEARNLHKIYRRGRVELPVLKGINLYVSDGEFLAITGPSGAGKSTLLHLLAGLDQPTQGEVLWEGKSLGRMGTAQRASFRNQAIGIVFQAYHLVPELSAQENVVLPGVIRERRRSRALLQRAADCLQQVGLAARLSHKPSELSGGEMQRVAIARALMNQPRILLCDEPTGNLDSQTGAEIIALLRRLHQERHMSLVLVTHEEALAGQAQSHLVLRDGCVAQAVVRSSGVQ
jgi:lipoprotein-releasing system ATP-binding protein